MSIIDIGLNTSQRARIHRWRIHRYIDGDMFGYVRKTHCWCEEARTNIAVCGADCMNTEQSFTHGGTRSRVSAIGQQRSSVSAICQQRGTFIVVTICAIYVSNVPKTGLKILRGCHTPRTDKILRGCHTPRTDRKVIIYHTSLREFGNKAKNTKKTFVYHNVWANVPMVIIALGREHKWSLLH